MGGFGQGPFGENSLALMDGEVEFLGRPEAKTVPPVWMWVTKRLAENTDGNPPKICPKFPGLEVSQKMTA